MESFINSSSNITTMSSLISSTTNYTTSFTSSMGSGSSSGCSSMNMNMIILRMDSRIWSKLPHTLIDRVLAFLPPPSFFRCRCVCKRWYSLLFSHSFLEMYLNISPCHTWFIFFKHLKPLKSSTNNIIINERAGYHHEQHHHHQSHVNTNYSEGYVYDPSDSSWYRLCFASLIPSGFTPASSSGGLICWISDISGSKSLILCNPLVKTLTQLVPTQRPRLFPSVGLAVTHSSFNLVVAGDDLISPFAVKNLTAESFHVDSSTGFYSMWGTTSGLPRLCSLESGRMVFANGRYYCMNYSPFSVLAYDVGSNEWSKLQAPMRRFLRSPSLVECRGKLILVAAVEKSKLNVPRSLRMWGLQTGGSTLWVEVERMPNQLYQEFSEEEGGNGFDCVGHGDYIVITIIGSEKMLMFDFYHKGWQWIPRCPFMQHDHGHPARGRNGGGLHGFAYEPQLATPIMGLLSMTT